MKEFSMKTYENLESIRLNYRKFNDDDLVFLAELLKDPKVLKYFPGPNIYPDELILKYLSFYINSFGFKDYHRVYLISLKDSNEPIGYGGIQYVKEFDKFEIFYGLSPSKWGQGLATEVSLRMKELAKEVGLTELIALAEINNVASNRVLEKTGFIRKEQIHLWEEELFFYEMKL